MGAIHNFSYLSKPRKGSNRLIQAFNLVGGVFPTDRIQSLTWAYMEQQRRLLILHDIDHQLYSKPEAGDEHIPLSDRGYVCNALSELV